MSISKAGIQNIHGYNIKIKDEFDACGDFSKEKQKEIEALKIEYDRISDKLKKENLFNTISSFFLEAYACFNFSKENRMLALFAYGSILLDQGVNTGKIDMIINAQGALRESAEGGNEYAAYHLAELYRKGDVFEKNLTEANYYYCFLPEDVQIYIKEAVFPPLTCKPTSPSK